MYEETYGPRNSGQKCSHKHSLSIACQCCEWSSTFLYQTSNFLMVLSRLCIEVHLHLQGQQLLYQLCWRWRWESMMVWAISSLVPRTTKRVWVWGLNNKLLQQAREMHDKGPIKHTKSNQYFQITISRHPWDVISPWGSLLCLNCLAPLWSSKS